MNEVPFGVGPLARMLVGNAGDGFLAVGIQKSANVGGDLADIGGLGLEIQAYHVEFPQSIQSAARRTHVVVHEIAAFEQLQACTHQVFANIGQHDGIVNTFLC